MRDSITPTSSTSPAQQSDPRRVALACMVGTMIEWYDFYIYGMAAALVFGPQFFPSLSPFAGALASFATFAVGFGARPLGGVILGHFGDRVGRKTVLVVSLLLMGLSTFAIGLLPTYATIGIWAPILLVVCRFLQGVGLGGEWGGAALMAVEHAPKGKRGLYGSAISLGIPAGLVLANMAFLIMARLAPDSAFADWGWRVPFLFSIVLVLVGLWVRLNVAESPYFKKAQEREEEQRLPVLELFTTYPRQLLLAAGSFIGNSAIGYIVIVYLLSYTTTVLNLPRQRILWIVLLSMSVLAITITLSARYSDRLGRRRVYLAGSIGLLIWSAAFFPLIDTGSTVLIALAVTVMNALSGMVLGPQPALFAEMFSTRVRYSGASLSYQLGALLGGAVAPLAATSLYEWTGSSWPITVYLLAVSLISLVCVWAFSETSTRDLGDDDQDPAVKPGLVTIELPEAGRDGVAR
ncbi:MFS transporter [Streptomyces sp. NBC_00690]|uniref:MFS transporter n=1 Tax=Streptomyces sp. NBC_00690 TaxID=2975808 RepID=UPI002E27ED42|nr:MFS transporter [Streptomyces sp. NBC_00690]